MAAYCSFVGVPSRAQLERFFFLDDASRGLIGALRRDHLRLGFGVQLGTVRMLGAFLDDPVDVPVEVVDYVAEQLGIGDPSCLKAYTEREKNRFEHMWEIRRRYGYRDFADAVGEIEAWVDARAWMTGDGPKALFDASVAWLRERQVLLPGVTTLARLVARVREQATQRLWETLSGLLSAEQRYMLDRLLDADERRTSELDRLRHGPVRVSGPQMEWALDRAAEIAGFGFADFDTSLVPPRRLAELSRYGMDGKATLLRRHPPSRRLATLLATVVYLSSRAVDDALDLLDLLITTKLLARAERESARERLRTLPRLGLASAKLAAAVQVLIAATEDVFDSNAAGAEPSGDGGAGTGEDPPDDGAGTAQPASLAEVWAQIEAVVPRHELAAAVAAILELTPPPDSDADEAWRAQLVNRFNTVRPFLAVLTDVVRFEATAEGAPVLAGLRKLPGLIGRKKVTPEEIDTELLVGSWRRLVLSAPHLEAGSVDWKAYVFCVLEQFHRHLRRRDIFAVNSSKWGDPRAKLLAGEVWEHARPTVLASLNLPEDPDAHLAERARLLDDTYRHVAGRLPANTAVTFDPEGRLHLAALKADPEPASLVELRTLVNRMLPRVDLPEVLLEVFAWTGAHEAFTSITGGESRMDDLDVSIAALLIAHGCNIGLTPVVKAGVRALRRDRLAHVDHNYLRIETIKQANAALIEAQAAIPLAQLWGGGLVASVDGMRFVVPVATIHARPNPRYWNRGVGATWLNLINDQAFGLGGKVVAGTPRDSLYVLDVLYDRDGGRRPETIVTDTASYSDIVFGLLTLTGWQYAPQLADLPDQKLWRVDPHAAYGPFDTIARGRLNLGKVRLHWQDILRVAGSIHTGAVRAHDVIRMISRDGNPTPLGDAIAHYGRIGKSLHILRVVDDETYRRQIKAQGNLQESRHALGRRVFHGSRGQLRQRYMTGMEDQLGVLGLLLNAIVLFNTRYLNAALDALRAQGYPVRDEDATRLSPFVGQHINVHGRYAFSLPDLGGGLRPLRDPSEPLDEDDED